MPSTDFTVLDDFDVEKYNACEDWDTEMWLVALSLRTPMLHFLRPHRGGLTKGPMPKQYFTNERPTYLNVAEEHIKNPIFTREMSKKNIRRCAPVVIRDFIYTDIFNVIQIAEEAEKMGFDAQGGDTLRNAEIAIGRTPYNAYLSIDMNATDEIILEKVGNWLKKTRDVTEILPTYPRHYIKASDLKGWHSDRLLPYLDLVFWAKLSGYNLSETEMGKMLFPPALDRDVSIEPRSKMRNITKKALRLISRENLNALATHCQTY